MGAGLKTAAVLEVARTLTTFPVQTSYLVVDATSITGTERGFFSVKTMSVVPHRGRAQWHHRTKQTRPPRGDPPLARTAPTCSDDANSGTTEHSVTNLEAAADIICMPLVCEVLYGGESYTNHRACYDIRASTNCGTTNFCRPSP